ncbi:MAG TPA: serine--tRNA ligase [bacterium]|jgi:seryl-tRNA synthetase|nr:serine--tRNA ligase [bacterium]
MLDLKLIRDNPDSVRAGLRKKGRDPGLVDAVLEIDRRRRELLQDVEHLRAEQNRASGEIAKLRGADKNARITQMREVSARLKTLEPVLKEVEEELTRALLDLPNLPHESVPPGSDERENVPLRYWGAPPQFDFPVLDHLELGTRLGIIDMERAAKVSGARFYYLRGAGVLLEQALLRFGLDLLVGEGFTPVITPFAVRPEIITGAWGGADLDVQQVYRLEGEQLALIGTSEQPLAGMYSEETFEEGQLPMRLAGISWNFRREAGSYGRDVRGLYRVHQFDKLEMFSFTLPEASWDEHEYLLSLEERILQRLGLAHRVVAICGGDTSTPSAKTYDLETWMPGRNAYGETQSCSNCTDFQARRLGIRVRRSKGSEYVHTLNGTAIATSRGLIAVVENYQQADGSVRVPDVLVPYMNGMTAITGTRERGNAETR